MHDPYHAGYSHVMHLLDSFNHSGPYGSRLCLITEVLGENVQQLAIKFQNNVLPITAVKQMTKQLLLGVDYLHSCGIIHTGQSLFRAVDIFLIRINLMSRSQTSCSR